jgi:hypothetical protein
MHQCSRSGRAVGRHKRTGRRILGLLEYLCSTTTDGAEPPRPWNRRGKGLGTQWSVFLRTYHLTPNHSVQSHPRLRQDAMDRTSTNLV